MPPDFFVPGRDGSLGQNGQKRASSLAAPAYYAPNMGNPEHSRRGSGPHAVDPLRPCSPQAAPGVETQGGMDRRAFVWSAIRGSFGLAAGLGLPAGLLAQAIKSPGAS